jgi:hypothetical protein
MDLSRLHQPLERQRLSFCSTATAEEIFVKVRLVQTNIKLVDNNAK